MNLTPIQWAGIALMLVGVLVYAWPRIVEVLATWPTSSDDDADTMDDLLVRMGRLAALQADLEARGHIVQAHDVGQWYSLLRDPIRDPDQELTRDADAFDKEICDQEAPRP